MKNHSNLMNIDEITKKLQKKEYPILREKAYRYFSVLLPILEVDSELHLLFERRSLDLAHQPNEICFPGGAIENAESPKEAAVRETVEELGLTYDDIRILSEMPLLVTPFGTILHPYVGSLSHFPSSPNPSEVGELFSVPLSFFLENEPEKHDILVTTSPGPDFPFHLVESGDRYRWGKGDYSVFFYKYEEKIIWGMTAKLVYDFVKHLQSVE